MKHLADKGITKILINEDNNPIGFINFCEKWPNVGYILLLAIDNANQRKGYGRLLINHAIEELQAKYTVKSVTIDVLATNTSAKGLYEKLGFVFQKEIRPGVVQGALSLKDQTIMHHSSNPLWNGAGKNCILL